MPTSPVPVPIFTQQARARIREALYLYGYLVHAVDWRTGEGHFTYRRISEDTGFPPSSIRRWMDCLRKAGEVATRKTPMGIRVSILNYDDIAATRKLRRPSGSERTVRPDVSAPVTESKRTVRPNVSTRQTTSGLSNINQILPQNDISKSLQTENASLDVIGEGSAPRRMPWEQGYQDPELAEARELLLGIGPQQCQSLMQAVMEAMKTSEKRYLKFLVKRNEQGELEPDGEFGAKGVLREMGRAVRAEALKHSESLTSG